MSHFTIPVMALLVGWLLSVPICLMEVLNSEIKNEVGHKEPSGHRLKIFVKSYTLNKVKRLSQH